VSNAFEHAKAQELEARLGDETQPIDDVLWLSACLENAAEARLRSAWSRERRCLSGQRAAMSEPGLSVFPAFLFFR
jgi:aspartate aminotransferase-like enzyme